VYPEISEQERFPMLTTAGRKLLHKMRQHPNAPVWNWPNGEQLNESGLATVNHFASCLGSPRAGAHDRPDWLDDFVMFCCTEVPHYRRSLLSHASLTRMRFDFAPTCCREDLAPRVWDFVPDGLSLDDLIVFSTSGTTGHPARMLSHPATAACGVPIIEFALKRFGIEMPRGPNAVSITNVAAYRGAYTTAIVVAYLNEAGCVRVNLDPSAWRRPIDCEQFINQWRAPIWLGDPIAYAAIEKLELDHAPKAILSSIMRLSPGYAEHLSKRYGCPVLDLYALTEVGILAVRTDRGHEILPHDVYVEIVDADGRTVPDGTRGEVTVTSRRNPYMPLLRYRTGDFASIDRDGSQVFLVGLEGRSPVFFPLPSGRVVHSMEVTRLMRTLPILQYRLHQTIDGEFHFGYRGLVDTSELKQRLSDLLEWPSVLRLDELAPYTGGNRKVVEYRSDVCVVAGEKNRDVITPYC
jgi:phenylacetate-CoA ligase